jgi:metal-responsive CopG/Arc/MetJ family transcriptional regulator
MRKEQKKENKQQFTIMLQPSIIKELDRLAEKAGLTRSQFVGNMIGIGLDEAKAMDRWGIFKMAVISRDMMEKFYEKIFSGKARLNKDGELEIQE